MDIFTDGACSGNPGPGGYGVIALSADKHNIIYKYSYREEDTTNNRMELKAILHALELGSTIFSDQNIIIHSDSAYCVNIWNKWIEGWFHNGWKKANKQPIENRDLVELLYNYYTKDFQNCRIVSVKAHCGILENELADALATGDKFKFDKICKQNSIQTEKD